MPDIVRLCYKSICDNADGRAVNLLTKENLEEYLYIPDFILSAVEKRRIGIANFSDLIRVSLLYK